MADASKMKSSAAHLALALAFVVTVCGCSRGNAPGAAEANRGAQPTLRIASQKGGTKSLILASHVLDGAAYQVIWSEFPSAQTLLEALGAGAVDLGAVGDAPFLFAYANNPKLKVVQIYRSHSGGHSVAVVVPDASPIKTAADLKGRKIATGKGSIGHYLLLRLLEQAHLKPSDVQIIFLAPGDAKAALASGAVDAWSTWGSFIGLETLHDHGRVVIDGDGLLNSYGFFASTESSIQAKRPQLTDFLRRLANAERWELTHQEVRAAALAKETGLPNDVALDTVHKQRPEPIEVTPAIVAEERATLKRYLDARVISVAPSTDGAFDTSFNSTVHP
jgi:sulfonate transport system substrate-binding protein